jgi:uncharacterized protein YuzE
MRLTYDREADAAFLYLVDEIRPGEVKKSQWVPLRMKGASVIVSLGEDGCALGVEFLGASKATSTPSTGSGCCARNGAIERWWGRIGRLSVFLAAALLGAAL